MSHAPSKPDMQDLLLFPCNGNTRQALDRHGDSFRAIAVMDNDNPSRDRTALRSIGGAP